MVIAAGSVVTKNLEGGNVYGGVPATQLKKMKNYLDKVKKDKETKHFFDESFVIGNITDEKKAKMKKILDEEKTGYII